MLSELGDNRHWHPCCLTPRAAEATGLKLRWSTCISACDVHVRPSNRCRSCAGETVDYECQWSCWWQEVTGEGEKKKNHLMEKIPKTFSKHTGKWEFTPWSCFYRAHKPIIRKRRHLIMQKKDVFHFLSLKTKELSNKGKKSILWSSDIIRP